MQQALSALQDTCGYLGSPPGEWRKTEVAKTGADFEQRLGEIRTQLEGRLHEVPQQISRVSAPPINSFEETAQHVASAQWFGWITPDGLAGETERMRGINYLTRMVYQEVLALAGGPEGLPQTIEQFCDLQREAASASECDGTPETTEFRNASQLVADSLRFVQQAAGKAADIHRARCHELAAAAAREGGKGSSSGATFISSAAASSGAQPISQHRQRSARHRPRSELPKHQRRGKSPEVYRPEAHRKS